MFVENVLHLKHVDSYHICGLLCLWVVITLIGVTSVFLLNPYKDCYKAF